MAAQNEAALLKIEAERRAGEMLAAMEKSKGAATSTLSQRGTPLSDLGITRNDSSRWQSMASLPDDDFTSYVETCQQAGRELTSAEVFRRGRRAAAGITEPEPPPAISYERCKELSDRQCRKLFEATPADRHDDLARHFRSIAANLETGVFDVRDGHSGPDTSRKWTILDDIAEFRDLIAKLEGNWEKDPHGPETIAHFLQQCANEIDPAKKSSPSKSGLLASIEKLESIASKSIVKLSVVELRKAVSEVKKCAESNCEETPKGKPKSASAKSKAQQSPKVRNTSTIYIEPVKPAESETTQQTIDITPHDCPKGMGPADYFAAKQKGISPAIYWESIKSGKAVAE